MGIFHRRKIMAIGRMVRPTVTVVGTVLTVREKVSRQTGQLYAHDVTVEQSSGARLVVQVFERPENPVPLPDVAALWAVEAEVTESQQYGASLNYSGPVTPDTLDLIVSASALTV